VTDLTGTQISSLLETLPGIAQVLRSPVADAFVGLIKAASGQGPFSLQDADEVMKYAVRRNLMSAGESEQVMVEARETMGKKPPPAAPVAKKPAGKAAATKGPAPGTPAARTRSKARPKPASRRKAKPPARKPAKKAGKPKARSHKKK